LARQCSDRAAIELSYLRAAVDGCRLVGLARRGRKHRVSCSQKAELEIGAIEASQIARETETNVDRDRGVANCVKQTNVEGPLTLKTP
jgi:hypothetical protein